jgi:hypothetical protein
MRAFYEVVNIGPGEPRQWSRDRTLYSPWIRFVALGKSPSGRAETQIWTHQELVDATEPLLREGFREREIHRVERRYGRLVQIDSTYEVELGPERKRSRGVNSLELYFDGARWWIASAMWQAEDSDQPIPKELLPSSSSESHETPSSAVARSADNQGHHVARADAAKGERLVPPLFAAHDRDVAFGPAE